tara:strand:+ start:89 stop:373 length:285 start_codon:yes stop_codon:yes gene_type:complete
MKKLFRVEINHVAYVWTEDQDAADEFVDFIRFNEDPKVDIEIAKEIRTGDNWGLDDSPYGAGDKSIKDCLPKVKRVEKLYDPMKDTDQHKLFGE